MEKFNRAEVHDLLAAVQPALSAKTVNQFMEGLKLGFDSLYSSLMGPGDQEHKLELLASALSGAFGSLRQKQLVGICVWPIFDKPALPLAPESAPEFLWLYALPVAVQFSEVSAQAPIQIQGLGFEGNSVIEMVYQSGKLNPRAILGGVSPLLTRDDLQKEGPINLSTRFVKAELGLGSNEVKSRGVILDPEVECARVVTYYIVGAARLPIGEKFLITSEESWDASRIEAIILAGLVEQGYLVDGVTSLPPCSMAEALLRCTSIGHLELHKILTLAQKHYNLDSVSLMHPAEGWAEVHGTVRGDPEPILITSPFTFVEPVQELNACVHRCCANLNLSFQGSFSAVGPTSSMIQ
jgi:hypothetical protein